MKQFCVPNSNIFHYIFCYIPYYQLLLFSQIILIMSKDYQLPGYQIRNKKDYSPKINPVANFQAMINIIKSASGSPNYQILKVKYNIQTHHIDQLDIENVTGFHAEIIQKYKTKKMKRNWCENELRIFIWILFHFEHAVGLSVENFKEEHWKMIVNNFSSKTIQDCKFQWLSLMKESKITREWLTEEDELLTNIISDQTQQNKWNVVAKQLYRLSEGEFFRKPKQCRERWRNYLDPEIEKGKWTAVEDKILLELVLELGKRWSFISKEMKNRTEHSVKNRYKSILRKFIKTNISKHTPKDCIPDDFEIIAMMLNGFHKTHNQTLDIRMKMSESDQHQDCILSSSTEISEKAQSNIRSPQQTFMEATKVQNKSGQFFQIKEPQPPTFYEHTILPSFESLYFLGSRKHLGSIKYLDQIDLQKIAANYDRFNGNQDYYLF